MIIRVFIQNQSGSNQKHHHDEKTLEWKRVEELPRHYPCAYGFIVGTTADDGCNVDCFVVGRFLGPEAAESYVTARRDPV